MTDKEREILNRQISVLESFSLIVKSVDKINEFSNLVADIIDGVIRELMMLMDGSEEGNEWISVNEKLPEKFVTVLTCSEFDRSLCHHDGRNWIAAYDNEYVDDDYEITHWMPIPDWPK